MDWPEEQKEPPQYLEVSYEKYHYRFAIEPGMGLVVSRRPHDGRHGFRTVNQRDLPRQMRNIYFQMRSYGRSPEFNPRGTFKPSAENFGDFMRKLRGRRQRRKIPIRAV